MAMTPEEIVALANAQAEAAAAATRTDSQRLAIAEENFKKRVQELETMKAMQGMGNEVLGIQEKELANNMQLLELEEQRLQNKKDVTNEEKEALLLRRQGLEAEARGIRQATSLMERYLGVNEKSGDMFRNTGDQVKAMATKMKSLANP